jgi:hypothetical protein
VNTLKSAAVIVVLLGVLYGVYVALTQPQGQAPANTATGPAEDVAPPLVEFAPPGDLQPPPMLPSAGSHEHDAHDGHDHGRTAANPYPDLSRPSSLAPPDSSLAIQPPADPTASGAARSSYETPAVSPAPSDLTPANSDQVASATAPNTDSAQPSSQPADPAQSQALAAWSLKRDWQAAEQSISEGKFKEALATLSPYYGNPDLSSEDRGQLTTWLDALAAKVIYSREHLLASPYTVRGRETLFDVAEAYHVPFLVLQNINGIRDPQILVPGMELKVVPGPFRADVNLTASEVTLFLGELYAGRFPLAIGNEQPQPGSYKVLDKRDSHTYYSADGRMIPANDPSNPYGNAWIDLGHEISIHGSPLSAAPASAPLGCISLSPQDARDVYGILSLGSEVTIRR